MYVGLSDFLSDLNQTCVVCTHLRFHSNRPMRAKLFHTDRWTDGEASSYLSPLHLGTVSVNNLNGNNVLFRKILRSFSVAVWKLLHVISFIGVKKFILLKHHKRSQIKLLYCWRYVSNLRNSAFNSHCLQIGMDRHNETFHNCFANKPNNSILSYHIILYLLTQLMQTKFTQQVLVKY
jgi:hypothetical protein